LINNAVVRSAPSSTAVTARMGDILALTFLVARQ
jgi:hypothetical protein